MIIYQVEVEIDPACSLEWQEWMIEKHIPAVLQTGCFLNHYNFVTKINQPNIFIIQYFLEHQTNLERYFEQFAPALQKEHAQRYQSKFKASRRVLQEIT